MLAECWQKINEFKVIRQKKKTNSNKLFFINRSKQKEKMKRKRKK